MDRNVRFEGKVAIVTGSAGGIGEAYARALAAEGASVVVADIDEARAAEVATSIEAAGGTALGVGVDVSDPASTQAMAARTVEAFGGIDHLVNNAAIFGGMEINLLLTIDWDYYRRFMSVNMDGALLCIRACWEHMAARGGGSIVNQSSTAAWMYSNYYGLAKPASMASPCSWRTSLAVPTFASMQSLLAQPIPQPPARWCPDRS